MLHTKQKHIDFIKNYKTDRGTNVHDKTGAMNTLFVPSTIFKLLYQIAKEMHIIYANYCYFRDHSLMGKVREAPVHLPVTSSRDNYFSQYFVFQPVSKYPCFVFTITV